MDTDARARWQAFFQSAQNYPQFERYQRAGREPAWLFDAIGHDLGSPQQATRADAFWALTAAVPELADIVHERESTRPGWRGISGADQQTVNRAMDIVTYLYHKLVIDRSFDPCRGNNSDPRRYINRALDNWRYDMHQRASRELSIDVSLSTDSGRETLSDLLVDHEPTPDETVFDRLSAEEQLGRLRTWQYLDEKEVPLFEALLINNESFEEAGARLGIRSDSAWRKRKERLRTKITARNDALLFAYLEILKCSQGARNPGVRSGVQALYHDRWREQAEASLRPTPWRYGVDQHGLPFRTRSITRRFGGGLGYLIVLNTSTPDHLNHIPINRSHFGMNGQLPPQHDPSTKHFGIILQQSTGGVFYVTTPYPQDVEFPALGAALRDDANDGMAYYLLLSTIQPELSVYYNHGHTRHDHIGLIDAMAYAHASYL